MNPKKWAAITSRRFYMELLLVFITLPQVPYASAIIIKNLLGEAASNPNLPAEGLGICSAFPPSWSRAGAKSSCQVLQGNSWDEGVCPNASNNEVRCRAALGWAIPLLRDGCSAPSPQWVTLGRTRLPRDFQPLIHVPRQWLNNPCIDVRQKTQGFEINCILQRPLTFPRSFGAPSAHLVSDKNPVLYPAAPGSTLTAGASSAPSFPLFRAPMAPANIFFHEHLIPNTTHCLTWT